MSDSLAGFLQVSLLVALLAIVHVPLGDYMARVYTADWRIENVFYQLTGVDTAGEQRWTD